MIKLLCSDIDGTLLNKDRSLSELTLKVLQAVVQDTPLVLASSRMPDAMRYFQDEIGISGAPLICYNGGLVIGSDGEVLASETVPLSVYQEIVLHSESHSYNVSTYIGEEWYTSKMDKWAEREINNTRVQPKQVLASNELLAQMKNTGASPHKVMCMGDEKEIDNLNEFLSKVFGKVINLYRSKPTYLEISNLSINKASALNLLLKHVYDLGAENVMAFGDNVNDMELLQFAGYSVAVGNATNEIKAVADEVTSKNTEDGVAKSIRAKLLSTR